MMTLLFLMFEWYKSNRLRMRGRPRFDTVTCDSLAVVWDRPTYPFPVPSHYDVYYGKTSEPDTWKCIQTKDDTCQLTITSLPLNTEFVVRVRACFETEKGPLGDISFPITTKNFAYKVKNECTLQPDTIPNSMPIYNAPHRVERDEHQKICTITIGEDSGEDLGQVSKTALLVSTPNSRKTTLLQGLLNFTFGVTYHDDFRFGLAPDIMNSNELYPDWVTVYRFLEYERSRLRFPLTLIDIPMLHGPKKKHIKNIHEQLKFIFNKEKRGVDNICIIANTVSLPIEQHDYILSVGYLFQSDLDTDLCCFLTSEESEPVDVENVLPINEKTFSKKLFVNLSAVYRRPGLSPRSFWDSNFQSFGDFLDHIDTSSPKILRLRLEDVPAPEKREKLKTDIANLQPGVTEDLGKLGEIIAEVDTFSTNRDVILSRGDFSFTIEEIKQIKEGLEHGKHVTNCIHCFFTCHENCTIPDDDSKIKCSAMRDGYCTKCTGHCIWSAHKNTPYVYHYTSVKVTKSYQEMKSNYETEKGITLDFDEYLENLNKDIKALLDRLHKKVKRITECNNELQGIQKSPLVGSVDDTINEMVNAEKLKKEKGYEKRIEMFLELKKYSNLIRIRQN